MYTFKGTITYIGFVETKGDKGFKKREFVVSPDFMVKYPNEVKFELFNENVDLIDDFKMNDEVTVSFSLRGKRWSDKFYTSIVADHITKNIEDDKGDLPF